MACLYVVLEAKVSFAGLWEMYEPPPPSRRRRLHHGEHVTSLTLTSCPVGEREPGTVASYRESGLWNSVTACLAACSGSLRKLSLVWHKSVELSHHFRLLRHLTALTTVSAYGINPEMMAAHTGLR